MAGRKSERVKETVCHDSGHDNITTYEDIYRLSSRRHHRSIYNGDGSILINVIAFITSIVSLVPQCPLVHIIRASENGHSL